MIRASDISTERTAGVFLGTLAGMGYVAIAEALGVNLATVYSDRCTIFASCTRVDKTRYRKLHAKRSQFADIRPKAIKLHELAEPGYYVEKKLKRKSMRR